MGALSTMIGVGLGAFGAHGLARRISDDRLRTFKTGVQYHLIHAVSMVLVGTLALVMGGRWLLIAAGWLFLAGIILFSGSLYGLAVDRIGGRMGILTPIGGFLFMAGWAMVAVRMLGGL